ncbi:MAG: sugar ABC transporter ATP-binding protein [Proteobacteria bacterium]|uniref:Sugar ABC transporter ATP-binding protein n=1 Tax=Candidatus Avisuccinivibrio stercorigallinarum TaxID=2840704 RepID=A0A9D9DC60_9GAMM|nr:sugar ABC transporter ATP-binding protein [Candidatus Avisuccinivibrio stercorigallinarum]
MTTERLSMRGMTKKYGPVTVLQDVTFNVLPGEVHALVGENGAGKSTLLNMLSGVTSATAGSIFVDGREVHITDPLSARSQGIAMIHQELQNVPELTVFQNMFLGRPITSSGRLFVNKSEEIKRAAEVLKSLDPGIDPRVKIKDLKVSQQQIVEIARALLENAKIIAMDEPTSSLTPSEFERLAELIRSLAATGVSIIYVSHKMDEIFTVCDRATVLRDGRFIDCVEIKNETEESIVTRMVGRKIEKVGHHSYKTDECMLEIKNLAREPVVHPASFKVYKGEVLGISGLVGAGRTELFRLIAGLDKPTSGEVIVKGKPMPSGSVRTAISHGIGLVPEDRKVEGILKSRAINVNVGIPDFKRYTRAGIINRSKMRKVAFEHMKELNLHPLDVDRTIGTLSGGNQQKVIIGRWLASGTEIFLFDEPTRGIDVGAKSEIYAVIEDLARQGKVVLVISSEMPEIIRVSDRVLVMREGSIAAELTGADINEENLGQYAIGQGKKAE